MPASASPFVAERIGGPIVKTSLFQNRTGVVALAVLCCLLWGSAYPAVKSGYALLDIVASDLSGQILFAGMRFTLAGALLLLVALGLRKSVFGISRAQWGQITLLGLTQTTIQYVFFYIGLAHATGVKAAIMNGTVVFFSVVLAHRIYADDRLSLRKLVGCLIGFSGVVVVNLKKGALGLDFTLLGEGFLVIAAFVLAAASIYGKRVSRQVDPIVMTAWQLLLGGLVLMALGTGAGGQIQTLDAASGVLLLYLALLSSIAFAVWSLLLKHNPVGFLAPFNFLIPVFGVVLSAIFLNESLWHWRYLAALVLVCGGIWLVTRQPRPAKA